MVKVLLSPEQIFPFNVLMTLMILYYLVQIPFCLFFRQEQSDLGRHTFQNYWTLISALIFTIQIVVRFHSSIVVEGGLIDDASEVKSHYLRSDIFIDILAIASILLYYVPNYTIQYVRILFFIKVSTLVYYNRCIEWVIGVESRRLAVYRLIKCGVYLFYFSHICTCIFFIIDYTYYQQKGFYYDNQYLWLLQEQCMNDLISFPLPVQYQYGLYWAIMTSTSVAYGDIFPKNLQQVLFTSIMFFPIFIFYSLLMNVIFETFSIRDQARLQSYRLSDVLKKMLRSTSIRHHQLHKLCYEVDTAGSMGDNDSNVILSDLSKELYRDATNQIYSLPFEPFQKISSSFVQLLYGIIKEEYFFNLEEFQLQSDFAYIFQGSLRVILKGLDVSEIHLGQFELRNVVDKHLNVYGFLTGEVDRFTKYRAEQTTQIYRIERQELAILLEKHNKEFTQLRLTAESLRMNKNQEKQCQICELQHSYLNCNVFQYYHKTIFQIREHQHNDRMFALRQNSKMNKKQEQIRHLPKIVRFHQQFLRD